MMYQNPEYTIYAQQCITTSFILFIFSNFHFPSAPSLFKMISSLRVFQHFRASPFTMNLAAQSVDVRAERTGLNSRHKKASSLLATVSRQALQPPIQWIPQTLDLGIKPTQREAHCLHLVSWSRMRGATSPLSNTSS